MGKASKAKRERRVNQAAAAGGAQGTAQLHTLNYREDTPIKPSLSGVAFSVGIGGLDMSAHQMAISCLLDDNDVFLAVLEQAADALGATCLDLVFAHPVSGVDVDIFSLAVALQAGRCLAVLTVAAGRHERNDLLAQHLNHLLICLDFANESRPAAFARAHLKDHFARSRKRGAGNVGALLDHARDMGFGPQAARLVGEIEAEELADIERRELESILAPRAKTRSTARAL